MTDCKFLFALAFAAMLLENSAQAQIRAIRGEGVDQSGRLVDDTVPGPNVPRTVIGTVFDSVANEPLRGAHVHLADLGREAVTDSLGAFRFDSLGPGEHAIWVDHPRLDTLGLFSLGVRVDATSGIVNTTTLAVPSFATLWHVACGNTAVPHGESGFIFGRVHVDRSVAPPQSVEVVWHTALPDSSAGAAITVRVVQADSSGSYAVCGVPIQQAVSIMLVDNAASTVPVTFRIGSAGVARRDMTLPSGAVFELLTLDSSSMAPSPSGAGAAVGGIVHDSAGRGLRNARVTISGVAGEWRTDVDGTFVVRGIPDRLRVVLVNALGFERERRLVDLAASDSGYVDLSMTRLMTRLGPISVRERDRFNELKSELDQRRRSGFGYRADSTDLAKIPTLSSAFTFPGIRTAWAQGRWKIFMASGVLTMPGRGGGGAPECQPTIWIDGAIAGDPITGVEILNAMSKEEIALIEVFKTAAQAPLQFGGSRTNCGVVLVWQKAYVNQ